MTEPDPPKHVALSRRSFMMSSAATAAVPLVTSLPLAAQESTARPPVGAAASPAAAVHAQPSLAMTLNVNGS